MKANLEEYSFKDKTFKNNLKKNIKEDVKALPVNKGQLM